MTTHPGKSTLVYRRGGISACSMNLGVTALYLVNLQQDTGFHKNPWNPGSKPIDPSQMLTQRFRAKSFISMGAPTKGSNVELTRQRSTGLSPGVDSRDVTPSTAGRAPRVVRENKAKSSGAAIAKPKRSRPPRGVEQKQEQHLHVRQHQEHQRAVIYPTDGSLDVSSRQAPTLPLLFHHQDPGDESNMRQNPTHKRRPGAMSKDDECQANSHAFMGDRSSDGGAVGTMWSHESTSPRKAYGVQSRDRDGHLKDDHEVLRRGLDDLLARPPPTFDYVEPDGGENQHQDSPLQQGGGSTTSRSLPELFLSRGASRPDGSGEDEGEYLTRRRTSHHGEESQRSRTTHPEVTSNMTASERRRANKPTRSQSGGLFRPAPCSSVGSARGGIAPAFFGRQCSIASARTCSASKNATVAASFKGKDAVLLDQAFAFAEAVAREEETEMEGKSARGGRKLGRGGGGSAARLPPHRGGDGGRLRRTRSSGSSVMFSSGGDIGGSRVEDGRRIEVEDWVRGLTHQSTPVQSEQHKHRQSAISINQASTKSFDRAGGLEKGLRETANRRRKLVVSNRRKQEAEAGALRFDRRREKEESKKAAETAELVKRFEEGTGVAALRAELEASRASMRRSAEAIEQVASRWHQHRTMPASVGTA